jgi:hypothetical protein
MKAGLPMAKIGECSLIISKSGYIFSSTDAKTPLKDNNIKLNYL